MKIRSLFSVATALLLFGGVILLAVLSARADRTDTGEARLPTPGLLLSLCDVPPETLSGRRLCLKLTDIPVSDVFALLVRVEVPDGWWVEAEPGDVSLSVRRISDARLLLLADGNGCVGETVLAYLTVHDLPGRDGAVRVMPEEDDPFLYYYSEKGSGMTAGTEAVLVASCRVEECRMLFRSPEGPSDSVADADCGTETGTGAPAVPAAASYIGCQEAVFREADGAGSLSVRFLFLIPENGQEICDAAVWIVSCTPARGTARLTVEQAESVQYRKQGRVDEYAAGAGRRLLVVTFSGLPDTGNVVFAIGDSAGELYWAEFREGVFVRHGTAREKCENGIGAEGHIVQRVHTFFV